MRFLRDFGFWLLRPIERRIRSLAREEIETALQQYTGTLAAAIGQSLSPSDQLIAGIDVQKDQLQVALERGFLGATAGLDQLLQTMRGLAGCRTRADGSPLMCKAGPCEHDPTPGGGTPSLAGIIFDHGPNFPFWPSEAAVARVDRGQRGAAARFVSISAIEDDAFTVAIEREDGGREKFLIAVPSADFFANGLLTVKRWRASAPASISCGKSPQ
jgi:hypothetical protein